MRLRAALSFFDTVRADSHHWPFRGRAMAKICSREMCMAIVSDQTIVGADITVFHQLQNNRIPRT